MFFGFNQNVNRNVIYALLIILAVWSLISIGPSGWLVILITLPAVIISITFHEYAHAKTADRYGDTTPRSQGRLTLNPLAHLDFFGFILMMFTHIGWGKPVQINPNNFNSNKSRNYCETMVALAGPITNYILAIISIILRYVLYYFCSSFLITTVGQIVYYFLELLVTVNIGLGTFNLIPLPPLDGEKIFRHILPYKVQDWLMRNYQTLYYIFMILWFFGILEYIVSPVITVISNLLYSGIGFVFSLFI